jgi:mRNA-degrading endonuclease toxin of MazEF toxin-antitoxin module
MAANPPTLPQPRRGQIWDLVFPGDPPGYPPRPVLIVSSDLRNMHPNASTVLAVPFSTTLTNLPVHIRLNPGETGLGDPSELQPENISAVRKRVLRPRAGTRTLSEGVLREVARYVVMAMSLQPKDI